MPEDPAQRKLRQQRELVHGSGAPASLVRVLAPPAHRPKRRKWAEMPRAERFATVFLLTVEAAAFIAMGYFAWRIGGVAGLVLVGALVGVTLLSALRARRRLDKQWTEAENRTGR